MTIRPTHTPGPWLYGPGNGCVEIADANGLIATTDGFRGSEQEERANATLIAAAPDMLAALRSAIGPMKRAANRLSKQAERSNISRDADAALQNLITAIRTAEDIIARVEGSN